MSLIIPNPDNFKIKMSLIIPTQIISKLKCLLSHFTIDHVKCVSGRNERDMERISLKSIMSHVTWFYKTAVRTNNFWPTIWPRHLPEFLLCESTNSSSFLPKTEEKWKWWKNVANERRSEIATVLWRNNGTTMRLITGNVLQFTASKSVLKSLGGRTVTNRPIARLSYTSECKLQCTLPEIFSNISLAGSDTADVLGKLTVPIS